MKSGQVGQGVIPVGLVIQTIVSITKLLHDFLLSLSLLACIKSSVLIIFC